MLKGSALFDISTCGYSIWTYLNKLWVINYMPLSKWMQLLINPNATLGHLIIATGWSYKYTRLPLEPHWLMLAPLEAHWKHTGYHQFFPQWHSSVHWDLSSRHTGLLMDYRWLRVRVGYIILCKLQPKRTAINLPSPDTNHSRSKITT